MLINAAGLTLWFPQAASHVLPGWMFNVALFVHGAEASPSASSSSSISSTALAPGKFPMDLVIFTGSVTDADLRERAASTRGW
jgi:hypothetical protein